MNNDVHPAIAGLVIAVSILAVGLWAWASGVAASYGGPAELGKDNRGHHYVQVQNYLVEHDANGVYLQTHDLHELGVEIFLGGFAFFSDGDVLLRKGPDPRSFFDNLRAYKRQTNLNAIVPDDADSGLFRCDLDTLNCERFGEEGIDFKATYGVFIDPVSDDVYISDTTRHMLRKYDSRGVEQVLPVTGFKFPNQLMIDEDRLLVADTNHHVLRRLVSETPNFAETIDRIDVVPGEAGQAGQTWPSHFARVGDTWWVNNMQTGMNLGGLYVFDADWQFLKRIALSPGADPIALMAVNDEVWVSDWNNDVVRRFTLEGEPLPDLESDGLIAIHEEARGKRLLYTVVSYSGAVIVAVLLLGLILKSAFQQPSGSNGARSTARMAVDATDELATLYLEPDEKLQKRMTYSLRLVGVLTALAVVSLAFLFRQFESVDAFIKLSLVVSGLVAIVALIAWVNRSNWGTFIKIEGDTVTLRDFSGRESRSPMRKVRYDDTAIATPDAVVVLGRPQAQIYARATVQDELVPRLDDAQRVGALEMLKIQVQLRHPQGVISIIAIAGVLIYGAVYLAF